MEVKNEGSDPPSRALNTALNTSFHVNKEIIMLAQSTFSKVFFETLQASLLTLTNAQPQLTRFSTLTNHPLTALTYFKTSARDIPRDTIAEEPKYHRISNENKREKKTSKASQEPSLLEKQESEEKGVEKSNEDQQSLEPIQPSETCKKARKAVVQNRIKNIPGLAVQRVRTSIKAYLTRNPKFEKQESRLDYIDKIFGYLSKQERWRALQYLDTYQRTWTTWSTIQKYLLSDLKYGSMLLDTVMKFFGEDGLEDFNGWLNTGRLGEKSKAAIIDLKYKIGQKFSKLILETFDDAKQEEEKHDDVIYWESIVKKEKEEDSIIEKKEECNSD